MSKFNKLIKNPLLNHLVLKIVFSKITLQTKNQRNSLRSFTNHYFKCGSFSSANNRTYEKPNSVIDKGKLTGVITDGDLRRMLMNKKTIEGLRARDIMNKKPKHMDKDTMAVDALNLMKQHNISQLLITDKSKYVGIVHLHDLVREGIL